ncbi:Lipoxygenase [Xenococcus sp. PCC 7305]|uniref:lipoxygenase family protein n=1 Tax=Xenococcus sp. PCC 7305 TaxID=102125 RepID=UPI0002ABA121|nr:lipoxygenase family protein [Xenococcus sp. PCC 7305]ELS03656.1 Lipoxygenase [Xenococcus sp. PCC 7305]
MQPLLPQNDPDLDTRNQAIGQQRQKYQWSYYPNDNGTPMVKKLPQDEQPFNKPQWIRDSISVILRVFGNQSLEDFLAGSSCSKFVLYGITTWVYRFINNIKNTKFLLWLLNRLKPLLQRLYRRRELATQTPNRPEKNSQNNQQQNLTSLEKTLQDYQNLFQIIYLPCVSEHFQEDREFAAHRVAGPNPLVIERVKEQLPPNFPVTDNQYQAVMGKEDSLAQAIQDKRLYLADYKIFDGIKAGDFPPEYTKYLCAPLALFSVPQAGNCPRSLVTVAIQCHQAPSSTNPIFTPPPPSTPKDQQWSWLIAKTIVQIADANYHELISHLGRTHLLIEPFVIATERELAPNHPLGLLLRPHFQGTLFINNAATVGLINKDGIVDATFGGTLNESLRITLEGVRGYPYSFNDSMLPKFFEQQGVDDPDALPDYPYRDDGMLIWNAIHTWVTSYISIYYHNDQDIVDDSELQHWVHSLTKDNGGRMKGFGESNSSGGLDIHSKTYLIDAVTLLIFTCSAQHAAVNFAQATYMSYAPNMPLAGYSSAPSTATGATQKSYLDLLPPLVQAEAQMNITYTLGSVYYTELGRYAGKDQPPYFSDGNVAQPLKDFQDRLQEIETIIQERNAVRPTFYNFLRPSKIPQSTNI